MEPAKRKKVAGRKPGTPNKTTKALKDAIMNAFEKVGGEDYLVRLAKDDPRTFVALLGKVLPAQIKAEVGVSGMPTQITFSAPAREEKEINPK